MRKKLFVLCAMAAALGLLLYSAFSSPKVFRDSAPYLLGGIALVITRGPITKWLRWHLRTESLTVRYVFPAVGWLLLIRGLLGLIQR
jgi:hypothetical protein